MRNKKAIIIYSVVVALIAVALQWLDFAYSVRSLSAGYYIAIVALGFTVLGVWLGIRLTQKAPARPFEKNVKALESLQITEREYEVLELLAEGASNREIGERLHISANTVKTHLSRLYDKLGVSRRTQATARAKSLRLIA